VKRISSLVRSIIAFSLASAPTFAFALTPQNPEPDRISAPELDPSSAAAVVVLLVGVALLAHRRIARA
jgi:hypothetical protein